MTVLLTRARPQAEATAARLRERGIDALVAPLMRIEGVEGGGDALNGPVQAILVTSHNGAKALAGRPVDRMCPVLAVGNRTSATLRDDGFSDVRSANGDAEDLAALALSILDPARGRVVHARGEAMARSPLDALRVAGFDTGQAILYRSVTLPAFDSEVVDGLRTIDTALVYSPGSARRLSDALDALPQGTVTALRIVGISPATLAPLQGNHAVAALYAAEHPSEDALLSRLEEISKNPVAPPENHR